MARTVKIQLVAVFAALVLVSLMVVRSSSAVFSDTTENGANSWTAGTVVLTDNDAGSALFTSTAMVPGDSAVGCVDVTYSGTAPASGVAFYVSAYGDTDGGGGTGTTAQLSDDLDVDVVMAAAGITCAAWDATGGSTLHSAVPLASLPSTFVGGSTTWAPTASVDPARAFRITVTLGADTADDAQGDGSTATFTWEAQS